eukprot:TRINITY_DN21783_c0_g2_i1.p1 TRINITY_DN21783_c0_g2~~TRINITY_DN21783_c0_g2_i1.p1  ORF type:complete len:527 (+),score=112.60 TRINITY_DN21783_c0_g2_i1:50-1582(+)
MYANAFDKVSTILRKHRRSGGNCHVCVVFLSDGRPSDPVPKGKQSPQTKLLKILEGTFQEKILDNVGRCKVQFHAIGFSKNDDDFTILKSLATFGNSHLHISQFQHCALGTENLSKTFSSVSKCVTQIRTLASTKSEKQKNPRDFSVFHQGPHFNYLNFTWKYYSNSSIRWCKHGKLSESGVIISHDVYGQGAERAVFLFQSVNGQFPNLKPTGELYVGKEALTVNYWKKGSSYCKAFTRTQHRAGCLAQKFNRRVSKRFGHCNWTYEINFLETLSCEIFDKETCSIRFMMVEKLLNPAQFEFRKWNGNNGSVVARKVAQEIEDPWKGRSRRVRFLDKVMVIDLDGCQSCWRIKKKNWNDQHDVEEQGHSSDEDEEDEKKITPGAKIESQKDDASLTNVVPSDFLQAFSHWTYIHTNRDRLVCDLQGIFDADLRCFTLTDPVIHTRKKVFASNGRQIMAMGPTDLGEKGMNLFFDSHACNDVCRRLELADHRSKLKKSDEGVRFPVNRRR